MNEKLIALPVKDLTGLRANLVSLLNELDDDNVDTAVICFERKGAGEITTYSWGNELKLMGLLTLVAVTKCEGFPVTVEENYDGEEK